MAEHPYEELNEHREQAKHHAEEARKWADAATDSVAEGEQEIATWQAQIAQGHGLAALATAAGGGGILSIEDLGR